MYLNTSTLIKWQRRRHASVLKPPSYCRISPFLVYIKYMYRCTYICQTRLLLAEDADIGEQQCHNYD